MNPKHALLLAMMVMMAACTSTPEGYSKSAYRKGKRDAQAEIKHGTIALETFGLPTAWRADYRNTLADKYGIEQRVVAGCIVDAKIIGHARGFNEVMRTEIEIRYGAGILTSIADKMEADYEAKVAQYKNPFQQRVYEAIDRMLTGEEKKQIEVVWIKDDYFEIRGPEALRWIVFNEVFHRSGIRNDQPHKYQ